MCVLLQRDGLRRVTDADIEALLAGGDRQPLIAQLTDDVKRLARLLFEREAQRVRRDLFLDRLAHVRRGSKESIGRYEPVERLMRPLEVVVREVVLEPPLSVDEVREHRAAQKLLPQRLPETLDLAQRLRMLGPATDVLDAVALEHLLELGAPAPHHVLTTVVG
jgi:hypothetical protein